MNSSCDKEDILNKYVNHSGGAYGTDTAGDCIGRHYGFTNHNHYKPYNMLKGGPKLLKNLNSSIIPVSAEQLRDCRNKVNKILGTNFKNNIAGNLHSRNYLQYTNADNIYCISTIINNHTISGGTNTAFQLGIKDLSKNVYVFDLKSMKWYEYLDGLVEIDGPPALSYNYSIIGTRTIDDYHVRKVDSYGNSYYAENDNYIGDELKESVWLEIAQIFKNTLIKEGIKND